MVEKIYHKKKLYALIVRAKFRKKKGISFFTPNDTNQQFGYMKHDKGHLIKPHKHKKRATKIFYTTEVIIIFKGSGMIQELLITNRSGAWTQEHFQKVRSLAYQSFPSKKI